MTEKNNKKTIWAWAMFDWANQAYNMVIISTIFPAYYVAITANKQNGDMVTFFGHKYVNTVLSNYVLAVSYLLIVLMLPIIPAAIYLDGQPGLYGIVLFYDEHLRVQHDLFRLGIGGLLWRFCFL
jgi:UMF1 family MFS transporter